MAGGNYELPRSVSFNGLPDVEHFFNSFLLPFLALMLGEGEDTGNTIKKYLGAPDSDSYWEFDKVNYTYKLYLNGTQYRGYNE